jgi:hypothetical protein
MRAAVRQDHEISACDCDFLTCLFYLNPTLAVLEEMKVSEILALQLDGPGRTKLTVTEYFSLELQCV